MNRMLAGTGTGTGGAARAARPLDASQPADKSGLELARFGLPDEHDPATVWVSTAEQARLLACEIKRSDRETMIVGVSAREGEERPAMSLPAVRAIVGPRLMIAVISWRWSGKINHLLQPWLRVSRGAVRVWPPAPVQTVVVDPSGEYGDASLAELEVAFRAACAASPRYVELLERRLQDVEARCAELEAERGQAESLREAAEAALQVPSGRRRS